VSKYATWGKYSCFFCVLFLILFAAGCGGGGRQIPPPPPPAPAVTIAPSPVTFPAISQGAAGMPTTIVVTNSGTGALNITSVVVAGTNPKDFATTNSCSGSIASMGTCNIVVNFTPSDSGALSETITITDNAATSPQVINVSGTANPIVLSLTPPASAMGVSQTIPFTATGDPNGVTWSVIGAPFLGSPSVVTSPGMIDVNGNYTGPGGTSSFYATVTATSKTAPTLSATATVNVVAPGAFTNTNNVQVAQYAVTPPSPATVSVQFGLTTAYGFNTWTQPNTTLGSPVSLYVAGMTQSTPYHMRGVLQFGDGTSFNDSDFTFTTGALPAGTVPNITATTTAGMTPQPGVEFVNLLNIVPSSLLQVIVTDLSGNIIWAYNPGASVPAAITPQPVKLLPNGHFLINFTVSNSVGDATNSVLQEVDLGSNVIWSMTAAQLNTALAAAPASCTECNVTILGTHHDVAILPNGHLVVLADTTKTLTDGTTPTGDVVIDLGDMENVGGNNPNHTPQPTWAWNEFNHFDTNRRPYSYPDWTHSNAVIYSKDDDNLIISSRHQNWLVKIDYNNGAGAGDILWKMGAVLPTDTTPEDTADFALMNADGTPDTNATDWFFAQHAPSFTTTNTTGNFGLTLFDNGDDRGVAITSGASCGSGEPVACYSTVPVFNIDETAKTATFVVNPTTEDYSFFGGNAEVLANGNIEYDECSNGSLAGFNGTILEVTQNSSPQTIWKMVTTAQNAYRGMRMGSLYPGVQW
jgi:arylsulfate sulfotransferase